MSDFIQREDRGLIAACLSGEQAAWDALIRRYQRLIYSIPLKSRLSPDDAADVFQSVCLKLYEKLDPNAQYNVVVDGFSLGHVTTDGSGSFKIDLSTENGSLPAQVRPVSNIQRVNVIDSLGRIVLTGGPPA